MPRYVVQRKYLRLNNEDVPINSLSGQWHRSSSHVEDTLQTVIKWMWKILFNKGTTVILDDEIAIVVESYCTACYRIIDSENNVCKLCNPWKIGLKECQ